MKKHITFELYETDPSARHDEYIRTIERLAVQYGAREIDELCHDGPCVTLILYSTHKHTCLSCDKVIDEGLFDCELDEDHDFALCDDCAKRESTR